MATVSEIEQLLKGQTKELQDNFHQELEKTKTDILQSVNKTLKEHSDRITDLDQDVKELRIKEEDRAERELQRDVNERKHNVIFYKVAENETSQDALLKAMIKMLNEEVENSFEIRDIDVLFRLGRRKEGDIRPILVRFTTLIKKELIMKHKKMLIEKHIEIAEDLPVEIRNRRKAMAPLVKALKENGFKASLRTDKIRVNGENWSLEKAQEALLEKEKSNITNKDSNINKRKEISPKNNQTSQSESKKRPPPLKLPISQNNTPISATSIRKFFDSPKVSAAKSPIVTVTTPFKNDQYVQIVSED